MKVNDEILSAFLDAELTAAEMDQVRDAIALDETLSDRLAELANIDHLVAAHYAKIDDKPLPESIQTLLTTTPNGLPEAGENISANETESAEKSATHNTGNVMNFPLRRRVQRSLPRYAGVAAAIALMVFSVTQLLPELLPEQTTSSDNQWTAIEQGLDNATSGQTVALSDGASLTPRLTFLDKQDHYCRQYRVQTSQTTTENIACKTAANTWKLAASITHEGVQQLGTYQTASGGSALDSILDEMIAGGVFNAEAEKAAIEKKWNK